MHAFTTEKRIDIHFEMSIISWEGANILEELCKIIGRGNMRN